MWAVAQMEEGKKVRRPDYGEGAYKVKRGNFIGYQNENGDLPHFSFNDYRATDWEVVADEKKQCEVIFGMDIKTDTKIPEGTVAIGYYGKHNKVFITGLKEVPEGKKTLSSELLYHTRDGFVTKEAYNKSIYAGDSILLKKSKVRKANQKFIKKLSFGMSEACITAMKCDAKEIYGADLI